MTRIREGWWLMLALCVSFGLWFLFMPLLGYGYNVGNVVLRPGWLGIPPCVFGAVYAWRNTQFSRWGGLVAGIAMFAVTLHAGLQFKVMAVSTTVPCIVLSHPSACLGEERVAQAAREWNSVEALRELRSPLSMGTFVQVKRGPVR